MTKREELDAAHAQGFLSDEEHQRRVAELSSSESSLVGSAVQLASDALNSEMAADLAEGTKSLVKNALKTELVFLCPLKKSEGYGSRSRVSEGICFESLCESVAYGVIGR